ncbi:MAG TPA: MerR family transcriptional regulator [Gaiellales bacterium]|nr:MerR family transcriptional regulator [Gaiellales bacterium]
MTEGSLLTIGEVARRAGVRTSTLRYYDDEGLVVPTARVGGRRRYGPVAVEQLATIRFCRALGFTLDEIRVILAAPRGKAQKARWRGVVDAKIAELDAVAARAAAMAAVLRVSRDCDCIDVSECASRAAEWGGGWTGSGLTGGCGRPASSRRAAWPTTRSSVGTCA